MNANKIMYALNNRVKELTGCLKQVNQIEKSLIKLTGYDIEQLHTLFSAGYTLEPPKKDCLVLKLPCYVTPDSRQALYDCVVKQIEQGVVIIPHGIEVIRVPAGVEFKFE